MERIWQDFLLYSALALAGILARFGYQLGGSPPPDDPVAYVSWRRKQLWAVIGEMLTIPLFGAAWIGAAYHWQLPFQLVVPGCLISGALGFGFWLDGFQRFLNRKIDNA